MVFQDSQDFKVQDVQVDVLGRARAHLQAVKKVSYGKHIVARVEKLVVEVNGAQSGAKAEARGAEDEKKTAGAGPGEGGEERSG